MASFFMNEGQDQWYS